MCIRDRNIEVVSLKGEAEFLKEIRATAEHTIGMTLALLRHLVAAHRHVVDGFWNRESFKGREVYQKTVGIVGYGRLGKIVADYFQAFGANVIANDVHCSQFQDDGVPNVDLDSLLEVSDVVSIHVDYRPENHAMIGRMQLDRMKPSAILVNTSRGELIDEDALLNALQTKEIAGAALDVLASEHTFQGSRHPLVQYAKSNGNLILTPHIGGYAVESLERTELFLANRVVALALN